MGPGGLHDWAPTHNNSGCIGGITGYIDRVSRSAGLTSLIMDIL